jgi:hypothetical protein
LTVSRSPFDRKNMTLTALCDVTLRYNLVRANARYSEIVTFQICLKYVWFDHLTSLILGDVRQLRAVR